MKLINEIDAFEIYQDNLNNIYDRYFVLYSEVKDLQHQIKTLTENIRWYCEENDKLRFKIKGLTGEDPYETI